MFAVTVRDHVVIAHSCRGDVFGPAQRLHGATYVVEVELRRVTLDADDLVVDVRRAAAMLRATLSDFDYRNLDDEASFAGRNTTTEFLAKVIWERLVARIQKNELGPDSAGLVSLKVTLQESHLASASFDGALPRTRMSAPPTAQ